MKFDRQSLTLVGSHPGLCHSSVRCSPVNAVQTRIDKVSLCVIICFSCFSFSVTCFSFEFHSSQKLLKVALLLDLGELEPGSYRLQVVIFVSILSKKNVELKGLVGQYAPILCSSVDCYHASLAEGPEDAKIWTLLYISTASPQDVAGPQLDYYAYGAPNQFGPPLGGFCEQYQVRSLCTGELGGEFWENVNVAHRLNTTHCL